MHVRDLLLLTFGDFVSPLLSGRFSRLSPSRGLQLGLQKNVPVAVAVAMRCEVPWLLPVLALNFSAPATFSAKCRLTTERFCRARERQVLPETWQGEEAEMHA